MGWEKRGNRVYYYRKIRRGRRVTSEYVGASEFAEMLFELDCSNRIESVHSRAAWKHQKDVLKKLIQDNNQLSKAINGLARASLLVSGYHSHKGQWRQTRHG